MSTRKEKTMFSMKMGPAHYSVKKVESLHLDGQAFGLCNNIDKEIHVRDGMQPEQELQTMLHEALHGIINEYAIRNAVDFSAEEEEVIVDLLALGLTQTLVTSPPFLKYINTQVKLSK